MKKIFFLLILILSTTLLCKAQMIDCATASLWVGHSVTVCGPVKSAMRDTLGKKSGMMLGMCIPYPHQPIMIVIKDETLPLFPYDFNTWIGKQICVSGTIELLGGRPFIEVRKRTQLIID